MTFKFDIAQEIEIAKGAKVENRRPWRPQSYFDQNRKW